MSEKKQPWMKWYPSDWRADPRLRMCSLAARGLWADILFFTHESEPYGHLIISGVAPSNSQLSSLFGAKEKDVSKALNELEKAGVFSRTEDGVIYSRRMVRDHKKAQKDRENGRGGGNPELRKNTKRDNQGVNPPSNAKTGLGDNPSYDKGVNRGDKAHMPEARSQKPEDSASLRSAPPPVGFGLDAIKQAIWNDGLDWLARSTGKTSGSLRPLLGKWCKDFGEGAVLQVLTASKSSPPGDPIPWITQALNAQRRKLRDGASAAQPTATDTDQRIGAAQRVINHMTRSLGDMTDDDDGRSGLVIEQRAG